MGGAHVISQLIHRKVLVNYTDCKLPRYKVKSLHVGLQKISLFYTKICRTIASGVAS